MEPMHQPKEARTGEHSRVGTGVFMPPSVQAACKHMDAPSSSPATTPTACSSRSSSFSSATGRPPQHAQAAGRSGNSSRPQLAQQSSTARKSPPCVAGDAQAQHSHEAAQAPPAQQAYGRFSLDEACARWAAVQPAAAQGACASTRAGALGNSLSQPSTPSPASDPGARDLPAILVMQHQQQQQQQEQERLSWSSTLSGDVCMAAPGSAAAAAAAACTLLGMQQQLQAAQQLQQQRQLQQQLAKQREHTLLAQREQERQALLAQLGMQAGHSSLLAAGGAAQALQADQQAAADNSALLAQLQLTSAGACLSARPQQPSYGLPVIDLALDGRACSAPLTGTSQLQFQLQLQLPQPAASPLPCMADAGDAADALMETALEAELVAALQQLMIMRSEVQLKRARATAAGAAARASIDNSSLAMGLSAGLSAASAAFTSQLYQPSSAPAAAAVLASSLYQPAGAAAAAAAGVHDQQATLGFSSALPAAVPVVNACVPLGAQRTSFSGFAPVAAPGCMSGGFGFGGHQRLAVSADAPVVRLSGGAAVHPMHGQPPLASESSMADWLVSQNLATGGLAGQQAGVVSPQAALQEQLQRLALRQAGTAAHGAGQFGFGIARTGSLDLYAQGGRGGSVDIRQLL